MRKTAAPLAIAPAADDVVYAVGDIHGRYDLLRDMLARIAGDARGLPPHHDVTCIFLGDYVDRGPDSAAVLAALLWLERNAPFECVFLRGNHEQVMIDYVADPLPAAAWLRFGGRETLRSYGVAVSDEPIDTLDHVALRDALLDRLPAAHLGFLQRLPTRYETANHIFVHAGVRPGIALADQADADLMWIREDFLGHRGRFDKRVVFGHTWTSEDPNIDDYRIGLDTGAYATGVLTAARLTGDELALLRARGEPSAESGGSPDPG